MPTHNARRKSMSTRWTQLALVLMLALVVAACGGGSQNTTQPVAEVQEEAASEEITGGAASGAAEPNRAEAPALEQAAPAEGGAAGDERMDMAEDEMAPAEAEEEELAAEEPAAQEAPATLSESDDAAQALPPPAPDQTAEATGEGSEGVEPAPEVDAVEGQPEVAPEPMPTATIASTSVINPFVRTADDNRSTFALDVDTASYTAARHYLTDGQLPPPNTVRVEEFVNYFHYDYPAPQQETFGLLIDAAPSPFGEPGTQIVRVGLQGKVIEQSERDDALLTFVIDISGSMAEPNRLPLVKQALTVLVNELRDTDQVAIVVYSDNTRLVLNHTPIAERETILQAIHSLEIEGATNVEEGLRLGYEVAGENFQVGAINRVVLCSDGVANVGATTPEAIRQTVRDYTAQGILLTTVGFGMGSFNDHLMEQLANDGNGNYAYIDTLEAAERFFVDELTGTLQVIAKDAKIQVEFNPAVVDRYRLLGYENRDVADEDFRNDRVDAGEVGAGHNVTALYEVIPTEQGSGTMLTVYLRYAEPEGSEVREQQQSFESSAVAESFESTSPHFQLAVAVAGFAEQLRNSGYAQERSLDEVLVIAERVAGQLANDQDVQEFVSLVELTMDI
jgi:Ca-activated chloride channel family protein